MSMKITIECPDCHAPLYIDSGLLLAGQSFRCANPDCGTSVSLSPSETDKVADAIGRFENLRRTVLKDSGYPGAG